MGVVMFQITYSELIFYVELPAETNNKWEHLGPVSI